MAGAFSSAFSSAFDIDVGSSGSCAFSRAFSSAFDMCPVGTVEDRGDAVFRRRSRYLSEKRRYYQWLQEELDRQLAEPEPQEAPQARKRERRIVTQAIPPPVVAAPLMNAGEATRLIREFLATQAAMKRGAMDRELMRMAEEMAALQDDEDAMAVIMLAFS